MLTQLFQTQRNQLLLQITLSISLALLLPFLKIPILFLRGLNTYIHPDHVASQQNGTFKAAIRRPSSSSDGHSELRRRNNTHDKSKDKFEFDESNAQIFRLKLDEGHLQTRLFFNDYRYSFIYSSLALSSLLLHGFFLDGVEKDGISGGGSPLVPLVFVFVSMCKVIVSLGKASFEKSASRRSERDLSLVVGFLGFGIGMLVFSGVASSVLDFDFSDFDGVFERFVVVLLMGCLTGFLYVPAAKIARSFWLGTDQLRSNMDIISCGWFARLIMYANVLLASFTALLWVNPVKEILINEHIGHNNEGQHVNGSNENVDQLAGNVGFMESEFTKIRIWCLLISGLFQILALRPNLQMYLNEALFSWYQRLHASKVPDLDFSRAKVFLHNHYLCHAVLQFFAPPVLVLLFLCLSQIDGKSFNKVQWICRLLPCTDFFKEVSVFMAWWVVFIGSVFTLVQLLLYRRGFLYIS